MGDRRVTYASKNTSDTFIGTFACTALCYSFAGVKRKKTCKSTPFNAVGTFKNDEQGRRMRVSMPDMIIIIEVSPAFDRPGSNQYGLP